MNINRLLILAGLDNQLLNEAREDNIAEKQGSAIFDVYTKKDSKRFSTKFDNPLDLIKYISQNTIPTYIQWTCNQYRTNPHFFLEDLPQYKTQLTEYDKLKKKARETVNKDINKYKNINELQQDNAKYGQQQQTGNQLIVTIYNTMKDQIAEGNAEWFYQSPNLSVYKPLNHEACWAIRRAVGDNNISLCVTYEDPDNYNRYTTNGDLYFIITNKMMYSFFFDKDSEDDDDDYDDDDYGNYDDLDDLDDEDGGGEFADINNNHTTGIIFYRTHGKLFDKIFDRTYMEGNIPTYFLSALNNNPHELLEYCIEIGNGRWRAAEPYIMTDPQCAYRYAREVIKGRWSEAEPYIMTSPLAYDYALNVIKGRWPEAEPYIMKNRKMAMYYKHHFNIQ